MGRAGTPLPFPEWGPAIRLSRAVRAAKGGGTEPTLSKATRPAAGG